MNIFSKIISKIVRYDDNETNIETSSHEMFSNLTNFGTKIDRCKEHADPCKYFGLFDKHIPRFENGGSKKNIALIDISNLSVNEKIINLNPRATYWLFDNDLDYDLLKMLCPETDIKKCVCSINEEMYNIIDKNMKFDVVVGNPPYDKSLHLKILKKTMEYVDFEKGGEIVWLHPARWLQSITSNKRKLIQEFKSNCKSFEIVKNQNQLFDIKFGELLISHFAQNGKQLNEFNYLNYRSEILNGNIALDIFNKVENMMPDNFKKNTLTSFDGITVIVNYLNGRTGDNTKLNYLISDCHNTPYINGNDINGNKYKSGNSSQGGNSERTIIKFNDICSAQNFINSTYTKFIRFIVFLIKVDVHIYSKYIPFMQDYTEPWTDERFYKYFKLTEDEINLIEATIKD